MYSMRPIYRPRFNTCSVPKKKRVGGEYSLQVDRPLEFETRERLEVLDESFSWRYSAPGMLLAVASHRVSKRIGKTGVAVNCQMVNFRVLERLLVQKCKRCSV